MPAAARDPTPLGVVPLPRQQEQWVGRGHTHWVPGVKRQWAGRLQQWAALRRTHRGAVAADHALHLSCLVAHVALALWVAEWAVHECRLRRVVAWEV